jgi:hypothetical protein
MLMTGCSRLRTTSRTGYIGAVQGSYVALVQLRYHNAANTVAKSASALKTVH